MRARHRTRMLFLFNDATPVSDRSRHATRPNMDHTQPTALNDRIDATLDGIEPITRFGHVTAVIGPVIRAAVPDVKIDELCTIHRRGHEPLPAQVIGFDRRDVLLMPLGDLSHIAARARVEPTGAGATVPAGPPVRARVLNAVGQPIDQLGPLPPQPRVPLHAPPPHPLTRLPIDQPLATGVAAIDGPLTIGLGQRVGIFAGAGVGKSTLLSMIARNVDADVVVVALIGERGREVREFLSDGLGSDGLAKATVVVSTSDQPPLLRLNAAYTATAIAEEARARGQRVVLMMDSVTRFARALRDVGLAAGEPPGRQGYPASVFATLPRLFERAGNESARVHHGVLHRPGHRRRPRRAGQRRDHEPARWAHHPFPQGRQQRTVPRRRRPPQP